MFPNLSKQVMVRLCTYNDRLGKVGSRKMEKRGNLD
jgi:hypothetical protein